MRLVYFFCLFLFPMLIFAQQNRKNTRFFIDTSAQKQQLGFSFEMDTNTTLNFEKITKKQFEKYRGNAPAPVRAGKFTVGIDSAFQLVTQNKSPKKYFKNAYEQYFCSGLIVPLGLYVMDYVSANSAIAVMFLVDQKTGKEYPLESPFDNAMETPYVSKEGLWLLSFSNNVFQSNQCCFAMLKILPNANSYTLQNEFEIILNQFHVMALTWIDEKSFAVSTYTLGQNNQESPLTYYRVTWKK